RIDEASHALAQRANLGRETLRRHRGFLLHCPYTARRDGGIRHTVDGPPASGAMHRHGAPRFLASSLRDDDARCTRRAEPPMRQKREATIDDLCRVPENGKAELVNGELVRMAPTGGLPGYAGAQIVASLTEY